MSFFFSKQAGKKFQDIGLLHKLECKVCPLYNIPSNKNKDIKPHGNSKEGGIYMLGLGPGKTEDAQGKFFCLEAETLVLMADLSWKKLINIAIGDRILTPEENPVQSAGVSKFRSRRWKIAIVTNRQVRRANCWKVSTKDGDLIGTSDHRVFVKHTTKRFSRADSKWCRIDELYLHKSKSNKLGFFFNPWETNNTREAGYLGGFLDGEGCLGTKEGKASINLQFSQNEGTLYNSVINLAAELGYKFHYNGVSRKNNKRNMRGRFVGGFSELLKFLGTIRPDRLIANLERALDRSNIGTKGSLKYSAISSISKDIGERTVVDITTTEGTFIANGFLVHNCGSSGEYLKSCFTEEQIHQMRFGNVTRTRDPNDEPSIEAVECCRPSVERDILLVKPKIIFGLGGYPLQWVLKTTAQPSINAWRGHPFPVNVAGHVCWYYPMFHPAYITRNQFMEPVFELDIKNAYKFIERNLVPEVVDKSKIFENCFALYKLEEIKKALLKLSKEPEVSIDIETTPIRCYADGAKILSISVGTKDYAIAFPWDHPQHRWATEDFAALKNFFLKFLLNKRQAKIAHNASFEIEYLVWEYNESKIAKANWKDTMSQSYCLGFGGNSKDSDGETEKLFKGLLSLDNLCRVHFGFFLKDFSNVDRMNLEHTPLDKVLLYNCGDTKWDHALALKLDRDVEHEGLRSIVDEHDRRIPTVVLTQRKGLTISPENAERHRASMAERIATVYSDVMAHPAVIEYQSKFSKFNIGAPADVAHLFKGLGFNVYKKDKEGNSKLSSDDDILKAIDHPTAKDILIYREVAKVKSTYVDIFIPESKNYLVFPDGKIHPNFTTHFTTTGRTSAKDPNVQNFPKRKNKEVRDIIVPPPGFIYASADFGQLEYRTVVMASKDAKLIEYVWKGQDIHSEWGLKIAKKYPKRVGGTNIVGKWADHSIATLKDEDKLFKTFRDIVKNNFVFAAFYGAGVPKLAAGMGVPESLTRELYNEFWEEFSGVKKWHEWAYKFYAEHGYIETLTGRRRYAPIKAGEIINAPIQGTGSDIVVDGWNRLVDYALETEQEQFIPVTSIHDDLGFFLPEDNWQPNLDIAIQIMLACDYPWVNVPLAVEASYGPNWYKQDLYGVFDSSVKLKEKMGII